jgi:hydrogenase expression/formation protein HypD
MKFLEEYRDPETARRYVEAIARAVTRPWTIMEICGGQTHSIVRHGLDALLPEGLELVHGPGCPVCVTPTALIDAAVELAGRPEVTFCSFGDMLRVPGSERNLLAAKAAGGDVRVVYSPLDAVALAQALPGREVVFFAVGFETTAPANALAVYRAAQEGLANFSLLVSHVLVPPAIEAILASPANRVQGILAAGHVCTVMGFREYEPLAARYRVPIVVTGFEPLDILQGLLMCVRQLEQGRHQVENQYSRSVARDGNRGAQELIREVFEIVTRDWRGVGPIERSGFGLRGPYQGFDALRRFPVARVKAEESRECIAGQILRGTKKPYECPEYGKRCTPEHPLGAPMVSTEGACAAYYRYRPPAAAGGI